MHARLRADGPIAGIRHLVADAIVRGEVRWSATGVWEKELPLGEMCGRSRSVASLAAKHARPTDCISDGITADCSLCGLLGRPYVDVSNHVSSFRGGFGEADLLCTLNNFPFCKSQLLVLTTDHRRDFSERQWTEIGRAFNDSGLAAASFQTEGSGATVPGHAHISLFDEALPIFALESNAASGCRHVEVGALTGYPAGAMTINAASTTAQMRTLARMVARARRSGLSANVILGHRAGPIVIVRSHERDPLTDRRVGNIEVGGILLANADQSPSRSVAGLQAWMRYQSEAASPDQFRSILQRTCLPLDDIRWLVADACADCMGSGQYAR